MPATTTSTGTDKFVDFDERRYTLRVVKCEEAVSPPPDNRPQFKWEFALEGSRDPETGGELIRRVWTSQIWNETSGKESHLVLLARALCGPAITEAQFNAMSFEDLEGLRGSALVSIDAKGWPAIDKTTFRPVNNRQQAALAAPVASPTPLPSSLLADPKQITMIKLSAQAMEVDEENLVKFIATNWHGATLATLTALEAKEVLNEVQAGNVPPF